MREYVEPTHADLQAFSAGRILKESWEICTQHFGALVMPMLAAVIAAAMADSIFRGLTGPETHGFFIYGATLVVTIGIHRAIILLKSAGEAPTFTKVFSHAASYWLRGASTAVLMAICMIPSYFAFVLLMVPGLFLWVRTKAPAAGMLLWAGGIAGIALMSWCLIRIGLSLPAIADNSTNPIAAIKSAWEFTRGKARAILPLFSIISGVGILLWIILLILLSVIAGPSHNNEEGAFIIIGLLVIAIGPPITTFLTVAINLTYQAMKPAQQEEENTLPAA